ncbi:single-stranded DNA-binding protein [Krasilnikovia sp. M28-CT-15]|uniref:single-stranded DNA-binding protein n=1 Tax=Krasilnikovia sp. M28-CT-15 TaxID=3373540 RepID=UPI003876B4A0
MQFTLTVEGNLADNPELRFTPTGKALCKFRVAHNTRRRNTAGEWVDGPTMWLTVTTWEALAERCAEHLRKGDTVIVDGRNDLSVWAYQLPDAERPTGQLQVTAANVSLSMRFKGAEVVSQRPGHAVESDERDPWDAEMADRENEPAF